jgi:hypothetical protein
VAERKTKRRRRRRRRRSFNYMFCAFSNAV